MTPHWSVTFRMVTSLLTDRRLRSWLSGAVLTTWRWSWTLGETPLLSPHSPSWKTAVESFRFLGTTISQDLKWDNHIGSIVKKAQQRLYFFHQLRKFNLPHELLKQFYSAIIESVHCTSITVWFSSATKSDLRRLRKVVQTAEWIIGTTLSTLQELYLSRVSKRADKIPLDTSHQHTPSSNYYHLLDATELWAPERPDTETVSFPKQSISWTLDIKQSTQHYYTIIYSSHIHIFHFKFEHIRPVHAFDPSIIYVTLSVKSRLKSQNLIMRKQASKFDFYH